MHEHRRCPYRTLHGRLASLLRFHLLVTQYLGSEGWYGLDTPTSSSSGYTYSSQSSESHSAHASRRVSMPVPMPAPAPLRQPTEPETPVFPPTPRSAGYSATFAPVIGNSTQSLFREPVFIHQSEAPPRSYSTIPGRFCSSPGYRRDSTWGGAEPCQPGVEADVRPKSVVICGTMAAEEVLPHLYERGCKNVTTELDESRISKDPVARGGGGDVYSGELYNGARVALKCVRLAIGNEDQSKLKKTAHELYVWSKCKHPNVLELIGVTHHRDQVAMVSPWMDNGDLRAFLRLYPNADRHDLCVQIADGVAYLHAEKIVHGDIKGANVLISQDGEAKITDFGTSALKEYTLEFATTRSRPGLSIRWAAPEVLDEKFDNSYQADIYALGMTMLEAITGDVPYAYIARETVVMRHIIQGTLPMRPEVCMSTDDDEDYGDLMWSLMNQCWLYEYQHRPSAIDIQQRIRNISFRSMCPTF
ncbi:Putative serine/threonine-protein kinase/receptor R818 [Rhizoctonia solani]|uniref:Putative serine/threonine-protein kinase/receptor R818 n=1 Tax=Rhizoctonia solani TaxID=456999 RepID=A0A0K6G1A7_9AGAM|nr:Putative serine/threonine-protein kinase/receptor R818 [Rhizoctonia solani]